MRKDAFGFPIEEAPRAIEMKHTGDSTEAGRLPGDFSFKVTHEPMSFDAEKLPLSWAVGGLLVAVLWASFLFFGSWGLNAKIQLFALSLCVGALVYNGRLYGIFGFGPSVLDAYVIPVAEDQEVRGEPLRISKWLRLVFSLGEAPVPEAEGEMHQDEIEERGRKATLRGFVEWMILALGFGWSLERVIAYAAPDGPYFYEIFAVQCVMLMVGVVFWGVVWIFRLQDDDWYRRRQHTEALNFLICRWCVMFLGTWLFVIFIGLD